RRLAGQLEVAVHHVGLAHRHPRVVLAVQDERGRARLLRVGHRAGLAEHLRVLPGPGAHVYQVLLPRDVAAGDQAGLVGNAHEHHRGGEALAVPGRAPGAGVAAVGPAGDPDPVAIDQADVDEVVDAVDQVVEL